MLPFSVCFCILVLFFYCSLPFILKCLVIYTCLLIFKSWESTKHWLEVIHVWVGLNLRVTGLGLSLGCLGMNISRSFVFDYSHSPEMDASSSIREGVSLAASLLGVQWERGQGKSQWSTYTRSSSPPCINFQLFHLVILVSTLSGVTVLACL